MGFIDDIVTAYERERSQLVLPETTKQDASYNRNYVKSRQDEFYGELTPDNNWADTSFELMKQFANKGSLKTSDIESYKRRKDLLAKGLAIGFLCSEVLHQEKDVLLGNI
ncbi:MAG TPA: hypothetical protein VKE88_03985, partial [Candidatus Nanoarchaeia archaeon]|nr:hypothetical protein [Candidatus Nanoarchaeia archaeon]